MNVIFSDRAYTALLSETKEKIETETGGIFLGFFDQLPRRLRRTGEKQAFI